MNRFGNPGERRGGERRRGSAFHVGAHASSLALILASLVGCGKGPAPATPVDDAAPPTNPAPAPLATLRNLKFHARLGRQQESL